MKKIAVITATRAEYGLLKPLLVNIEEDDMLDLQLIVTGTHLIEEYGATYKEIEKEFQIYEKIKMDLTLDDKASLSIAMAKLQEDITAVFVSSQPDMVVILGDRYEMLSIAISAMMLQIPIAHIHGGEITEGAIDDTIRHAITKLSYLHFTSTKEYKRRVIQMGEEPERVFNVGSLGVQTIQTLTLLSKEEFESSIGLKLGKKNLLITYHPQTLSSFSPKEQIQELLNALERLENTTLIFTKANADEGGQVVNSMIDSFVAKDPQRRIVFASLGQLRYFSAIKYVDGVVGNSSSGILEVPSLKTTTIDIGNRQKGRVYAESVIKTDISSIEIESAIKEIYKAETKELLLDVVNPYEANQTSKTITKIIKMTLMEGVGVKNFYNIQGEDYAEL